VKLCSAPLIALFCLSLAGCAAGATTHAAGKTSTAAPASTPTQPHCPNPEGMNCLGQLAGGTYTTQTFDPKLSYTVPAGWSNMEDMYGNFLLLPPGQPLAGVNPGTSDYIGVYTSVYPVNGCSTPDGDVTTPAAYLRWLQRNRGLAVSSAHAVKLGGLAGYVADLRIAKNWRGVCEGSSLPTVTVESGSSPTASDLIHGILKGSAMRLYLFAYHGGVLSVEIDDVHDAHHLDSYSAVASHFDFHQA
jgi:hypothetical protein